MAELEQQNCSDKQMIPVYLLTGFLGSGKTTFLQKAIDYYTMRGLRPAVIMNELGEVNLDGTLVAADIPMMELLGGCICCTVSGDLAETIDELIRQEQPDVLFVEATGVANPAELLDAVTDFKLVGRINVQSVIALVDGPHYLEQHRRLGNKGRTMKLMRMQVQYATLVLLNKIDGFTEPGDLAELEQVLQELNPHAPIMATVFGGADMKQLEKLGQSSSGTAAARPEEAPGESEHDHSAAHHSHQHVIMYTHYLGGPVDRIRFETLLRSLPEEVLRAKGIVQFTGEPGRFMFQFAFREPVFIRINPRFDVPDVAVFIGESLSKEGLAEQMREMEV